jgi:hypothetical protein
MENFLFGMITGALAWHNRVDIKATITKIYNDVTEDEVAPKSKKTKKNINESEE